MGPILGGACGAFCFQFIFNVQRPRASIKDMDLPPQERFEAPLTSSQEYGWHHKPMVPQNPMFYFTKGGCDITQYADSYVQMKGTTPFSRKIDS